MDCTAIILLCSCLLSILMFNSAADTITANQTISDGQTIVSAGGQFEMGFFSTAGLPLNRYFGIWYKKIANGSVVWVANRESPIFNTSGVVKVSSRGIVVSTNQSTDSIWTSNSSGSVKNPVAQLLDSGNLVFRDENEQQNFAWQSFDHPVDTILPRMKFGYDLVTGKDWYLVPWKSLDDPAPGNYIQRVDKNGYPQLFLWKDSVPWYRTGPWVGSKFSGLPIQEYNELYITRFVITETEAYYVFDLLNSETPITRLTLTPGGVSARYIWNREKNEWTQYLTLEVSDCDRYAICGTNGVCNVNKSPRCECLEGFDPVSPEDWAQADWTDGCSRKVQLKCGNGDGFLNYTGVKLPDTQWSWYSMSLNLVECEKRCLKDCNCTAYSNTDIRNGGSGCLLWFGGLKDMRGYSDDGQDLYVRMPGSGLKGNKHSEQKTRVRIVLIPVSAVLAGILCLFLLYRIRKKRINRAGKEKTLAGQDLDLPIFSLMQIAKATDNFSDNRQLGKGGFGTVYKGILEEGQEIAVKRLSKDSRQGLDEFMNEVSCIAKLQHRNLVMLRGCCIEEGERLLIYEYLPNKSLDYYIFDKNTSKSLNWPKRYNIIVGIARGLLYLHRDSRLKIIHRDLKASNILLDHDMNPKISDFGLARTFGESETPASTTRVVGTHGYMSPEYAFDGLFSVKSDVYSFGVSLLEVITGKRNRAFVHPGHSHNLIGHVWKRYTEGNLLEVVDSVILESISNQHEVFRVIQIGLLCVQEYPEDRPNMSSTIMMLTTDDTLPVPKQPGFFSERRNCPETGSSPKASTTNTISVTYFAAR
ncbi:G-type lectin S-receptor-like serine/threonine-protein kinase At4g27290 isoform X4 [Apium graveolens]|uniref:G-type lectin S-receptor-like serine/threonine-protein kinase At4g27290 isoform X4 n=1 Tax=Apium graveolens TaxID=4045 RepID=UPI003D7A1D3C